MPAHPAPPPLADPAAAADRMPVHRAPAPLPTPGVAADPFIERFLARVPREIADGFDDAQLTAIKMAFGGRAWGQHAIDIRRPLRLFGWRFYVVLLAGREHRSPARLAHERANRPFWNAFNAMLLVAAAMVVLLAGSGALYVTKRAAGVDLFPGIDVLPDQTIERLID